MIGNRLEKVGVYGIGNPLIDVITQVSNEDISALGLHKGSMALIDTERGNAILRHLDGRVQQFSCGGSAPNTIITLAGLGVRTSLAGMIGDDRLGEIYRKRLAAKGVHSDLVTGNGDTGTSIILVTPDHERTMNTRLGVCQNFSPDHVYHQGIAEAMYLYFTGYMWDTEPQKKALESAIETARRTGTQVVFDVADPFAVERHSLDFLYLIDDRVDILLANREEARLLLGYDDPVRAARELSRRCRVAAVKLGVEGSIIAGENEDMVFVKAYPVEAIDSTGAGDNYSAGFLYGLINGYSLEDSGKLASYIAAQIVRQTGAQFEDDRIAELRKVIEHPQKMLGLLA